MQVITSATFSKLRLEDLEGQIVNLSEQINASEYKFLVLLREFDLRQGWVALAHPCARDIRASLHSRWRQG